ncbi:hypothetical protein [Ferviditalea candida]|uniref:Uncharacterized protein n=1 Tax=Ferviditalea candida TaxID=3108399 RepID=A0ABU5ZLK4_9BACL|nr:hypothetical protein [Paenibacillaceae bacterium T2]
MNIEALRDEVYWLLRIGEKIFDVNDIVYFSHNGNIAKAPNDIADVYKSGKDANWFNWNSFTVSIKSHINIYESSHPEEWRDLKPFIKSLSEKELIALKENGSSDSLVEKPLM